MPGFKASVKMEQKTPRRSVLSIELDPVEIFPEASMKFMLQINPSDLTTVGAPWSP